MSCDKVRYANKKAADEDIKRIQKKSNRATVPIRSYQCKICKGSPWHLTSSISYAETIKELTDKNNLLQTENELLKAENTELKKDTEEHRQARIQAKAALKLDDRMTQLANTNVNQQKQIKSLRKDNSELISRVVQLNKKLEAK